MENNLEENKIELNTEVKKPKKIYWKFFLVFVIIIFSFFGYLYTKFSAPKDFKLGEIFIVKEGSSLRSLSKDLEEEGFIKSRVLFESFVIFFGGEKRISGGDYIFKEKYNVLQLAEKFSKGEKGLSRVKITIPEGYDIQEMAEIFEIKLHNFNKENFLNKTEEKEGYLFPDTYFFLSSDNEDRVIKTMSDNFIKKTSSVFSSFNSLPDKENKIKEIIIMASLVEGEANGDEDRDIISGILWKRIEIGMPLQVDVAPITYKQKGLPNSPISNPGLASIKAALYPKSSSYLYYIHDKEGNTHFGSNFKEHRENIEKYLK